MNIFRAYINGFRLTMRNHKMLFFLYAVNILTALILVVPFFQTLKIAANNTVEIESLLTGFDFNFFVDLAQTSAQKFLNIFSSLKWIVLVYWLLSIFFLGGIIKVFNKDKFSWRAFFVGSFKYFLRFLFISLIFLILQVLLFLMIWIPFVLATGVTKDLITNEQNLFIIAGILIIFHGILSVTLQMASDYSKYYLVFENKNIFRAILSGFGFVSRNYYKTFSIFIVNQIVPVFAFYIYFNLSRDITTQTIVGIVIMFIIQQIYIFCRIIFKTWRYASEYEYFTYLFLKNARIKASRMIFENIEVKTAETIRQWQDNRRKSENNQ